MRAIVAAVAALIWGFNAAPAKAEDQVAERWDAAIKSARWTGPLLASNAETLPQGRVYTEPYLFDAISGDQHNLGSSGFYQYGLLDNYTVGVQPYFAIGTRKEDRGVAIGDFKLLSQLRLSHFTPEHRVPSVSVVLNLIIPTGKHDNLKPLRQGHGAGSFAPEIGVNAQQYFLLKNGRLLRARLNFLKNFPLGTDVSGRSVYQTTAGFRGHAKPGSKTTFVVAVEYSLSREWVLAFDIQRDEWDETRLTGHDADGVPVKQTSPKSWNVGFAPAVEYNWSDRAGAILGVWIVPKGHNTVSSITPAIAVQRVW